MIRLLILLTISSLSHGAELGPKAPSSEQKVPESLQDKQELYLVVGSTREESSSFGPLIDKIYGSQGVDLTHLKTFKGKATTLDLFPSELKDAPHIIADARTYDFSKYVIASAFLERLSTLIDCSSPEFACLSKDQAHLKHNYMGAVVENILKYMKPDGTLEIEWSPYTTLSGQSISELDEYISANPFHCFLNFNVVLQAVFILGGDTQNIKILSREIVKPTLLMVTIINRHLRFYHAQGAGKSLDELKSLIYQEALILLRMIQNGPDILLDCNVQLHNLTDLKEAFKKAVFGSFAPEYIGKRVKFDTQCGWAYNQPQFNSQTFLNFVIDDIAAEHNRPHVIRYLESLGLRDISITKGDNPHNGRKNIWMIKARK